MAEDRKCILAILKDLAETSSWHGIPKIVSSRQRAVKVLWSLLYLATVVVWAIQIYSLFMTYYSFPIQTKVSLGFNSLTFPAITLCNMNPVRKSQLHLVPDLERLVKPKERPNQAFSKDDNTATKPVKARSINNVTTESTYADVPPDTMPDRVSTSDILSATATPAGDTVTQPELHQKLGGTQMPDVTAEGNPYKDEDNMHYIGGDNDSEIYGKVVSGDLYDSYDYFDLYDEDYDDDPDYYSIWDEITSEEDDLKTYMQSPVDRWEERAVAIKTLLKTQPLTDRLTVGHQQTDLVHRMSYARRLQNVTKTFRQISTADYGNCYELQHPSFKAWRSGPDYGIKLVLNLEVDEYVQNFATGYGLRIVFHEPGTLPLPAQEGLTLRPGFDHAIGLRMIRVSRLGQPHGECRDGVEFKAKHKLAYTVAACMDVCRVQQTIIHCSCIPYDAPDIDFQAENVRICNNRKQEDRKCKIFIDAMFQKGVDECNCISPCQETVYEKTMSGRLWPTDAYLSRVLMKQVCKKTTTSVNSMCLSAASDDISNRTKLNFVKVQIYFEDLNFQSVTEEPLYEGVRFLSDLGGVTGLFLGASVLSFMEIFQLLLEITLYITRRLKRGQAAENKQPYAKPTENI